ncbi:MAG: carbohydrate kinase family protein [Verrucomicrobiaceae bacterium]|nr:MAG: carbohydrate kinase family protein [Verrucomicrobiaceae bacterium]
MRENKSSSSGLLAAGNFIVDHVKLIDYYPAEEMLASILEEHSSNGGGPYNVLMDLARMGAPFPLAAVGLLGRDPAGDWIVEDCRKHGIDTTQLERREGIGTSYTDAFTVASTGRRTFFHHRGANAAFTGAETALETSTARLFYLGYLMLLDTLDESGPDGRSGASHLLERASNAGLTTVADMVSVSRTELLAGARSALPWIDHFILNEIEAGQLSSRVLRAPGGSLDRKATEEAAQALLEAGVRRTVTIHAVEGAVSVSRQGVTWQASLNLPQSCLRGATGAGDAFAAGWILGLHEGLEPALGLKYGVCAAAACLSDPTPSGGLKPLAECLALADQHGIREWE